MPWGMIAGAAISAAASMANQNSANKNAQKNAQAANDFTKEQWLNKHQWEVEDLKKAGLNPILSAQNGGGPAGSAMASTQMADVGSSINSGASAAKIAAMLKAEKEKVTQETETMKSQEDKNRTDAKNQTKLVNAQVKKMGSETKGIDQLNEIKGPASDIASGAKSFTQEVENAGKAAYKAASKYDFNPVKYGTAKFREWRSRQNHTNYRQNSARSHYRVDHDY